MIKPSRNRLSRRAILISGTIVAVLVTIGILEATNTINLVGGKSSDKIVYTPNKNGQNTTPGKGTQSKNQQASSSDETSSQVKGDKTSQTSTGTRLIAPYGNFVSAHHNVPMAAAISSVCNTTPGASCKIVFTGNGTSKSLDAQTTDSLGTGYWNSWTPASIGLSPGSWKVQAIATLADQTQTSDDAISLDIVQ